MQLQVNLLIVVSLALVLAANCHQICGRNEVYNECGSACPLTCQKNRQVNPLVCNRMCVPGCFCREGFLRDVTRNNECVLEKECADRDYL